MIIKNINKYSDFEIDDRIYCKNNKEYIYIVKKVNYDSLTLDCVNNIGESIWNNVENGFERCIDYINREFIISGKIIHNKYFNSIDCEFLIN